MKSQVLNHIENNIAAEIDEVSMAALEEKGKYAARLELATKALEMGYLVAQTMIAWQIASWFSYQIDYLQALLIVLSINFLNWVAGTLGWDLLGLRKKAIRRIVEASRNHGPASMTVRGLVMLMMKAQVNERKAEAAASTRIMFFWGLAYMGVAVWAVLAK